MKEGTGPITVPTPDTETKLEGMNIYKEFSDLSMNYTTYQFEFERGNNCPSIKRKFKKKLIFWLERLSATSAVLEIIDKAYEIRFFKTYKDFVEESISEESIS